MPFRAQTFAIAFTGLIRNGAYGGGEGFCKENPLTPTGWSRRIAVSADRDLGRLNWAE
jgi:hypothetical protein